MRVDMSTAVGRIPITVRRFVHPHTAVGPSLRHLSVSVLVQAQEALGLVGPRLEVSIIKGSSLCDSSARLPKYVDQVRAQDCRRPSKYLAKHGPGPC